MIPVTEGEDCLTYSEAAAMLGVSYQTIWRYAGRLFNSYQYETPSLVPKSEIIRFRDEIRPTFRGGPGRPKGSKNKRQRKNGDDSFHDLSDHKTQRMTKEQRLNYLLSIANEMLEEEDY